MILSPDNGSLYGACFPGLAFRRAQDAAPGAWSAAAEGLCTCGFFFPNRNPAAIQGAGTLLMMMDTASVMLHLSSASGRILQWSPGIHPVRAAEIGFHDEEEPVPAVRRHFGISRSK